MGVEVRRAALARLAERIAVWNMTGRSMFRRRITIRVATRSGGKLGSTIALASGRMTAPLR
jgi:hypothetical protein